MSRLATRLILFAACAAAYSAAAGAEKPDKRLVRIELEGRPLAGMSLFWSNSDGVLLLRDGRMRFFHPAEARGVRRTNDEFRAFTPTRMRNELTAEFGSDFEITSTGNYLVVHPPGQGREWGRRFDELYRSFRHFFSVRGLTVKKPPFPLVAVVFHNREHFLRYTARDLGEPRENVLGYYSPTTNRVAMYDVTAGQDSRAWFQNAETLIHEATHQTAFNTGIHNRLRPPPRWVVEGLGMLFESRGVWDSRHSARATDRINAQQLALFRRNLPRRPKDAFTRLLTSDRPFETDMTAAYAESWAWTYYLIETQPRKYAAYLQKTSQGKPFSEYTSSERLTDFVSVFGSDLLTLEAQFLRFVEGL